MATIKQVRKHILECMKECIDGDKMEGFADALMTLHDIEYYEKNGRHTWQKDVNNSDIPSEQVQS